MSDVAVEKKLAVGATIKEGFAIGMKNIGPILVNVLLWVLTIWIPYLNVGTTIGLMVGIVTKASRGQAISMTEIFNPDYRKYMGEYFLTSGLVGLGVGIGIVFFIIPGIVICMAWSLAILLVIDKGKNPSEAITLSNKCTYGYKGRLFGIYLLIGLAMFVVTSVFTSIGIASYNSGVKFLMGLLSVAVSLFVTFVYIGVQASVYKQLTGDV